MAVMGDTKAQMKTNTARQRLAATVFVVLSFIEMSFNQSISAERPEKY